MIRSRWFKFALAALGSAAATAACDAPALAAPITAGNLVVYRVGDGSAALTNAGTAVFLDEYTATGTLVQSIALPTAANGSNLPLVASGTATSEGLLTRSADGRFIVLAGYGTTAGTAGVASSASTSVPRVIGLINAQGTVDTTTGLTDAASANNPRSATSTNGTDLWLTGGAGGIRYATKGGTTSTQLSTDVTNLRQTNIFNGQLYVSTSSGTAVRLGTVGTGTPTASGQSITNLLGIPATGSPYAFHLADLSTTMDGPDTLYLTDDTANTISKFSLVGGTWTLNNTVAATSVRGLTASVSGTTVSLYATNGTLLTSLTDTAGYNANNNGTLATIATAATNTAFRGVALAPVPEPGSVAVIGLAAVSLLAGRRRRRI
ncbi:MAG TPA: PEP-CTERM sorting domain-containing protein [Humisphaera sp.]